MSRIINFFIMIYLISFIFASSSERRQTGNRSRKVIRKNKYNNRRISNSLLSRRTCLTATNSDPNHQKADSSNATNSGLSMQSKKTQGHKVYTVVPPDATKVGDFTFFLEKTDKEPTNDNEKDISQSVSLNNEEKLVPYLRNRHQETSDNKEKNSQELQQSGESTNETRDRLDSSTKQDGYRLSDELPHPYKISFNRRVLSNRIAALLQPIKRRKGRLPTK